MKPPRILLLDLNSASDSGGVLRDIIESHFGADGVELIREAIDGATRTGELSEIILSSQPDVVILVPSGAAREEARQLLQSAGRERLPAPVVVADEPCEMAEWLRLGAADFINAPPEADELLPRVGKLLEQVAHRERRARAIQEKLCTTLLVGESPAFLREVNKIPPL